MAIQTKYNIHDDLVPLAIPIDQLDMLPGNPNQGDVEAIARSYKKWGQRKPVVGRRMPDDRWEVSAGNHQLLAARDVLGWTHLALRTEDNEAEGQAFAIADNHTSRMGHDDDGLLLAMMEAVNSVDAELLAAASYSDADLAALRATVDPPVALVDPDELPPIPATPVSALGDVWLLGPHRVLCGDAQDDAAVDQLMNGTTADLMWTDPPYGVKYVGKTVDALTIDNDDLDAEALELLLKLSLGNGHRITKPGGCWYIASPSGAEFRVFAQVLSALGVWRQTLVWVKDSFVMGRSDYHYRHESIFYGWRKGAAHHAVPSRDQDTVWEIARPKRSSEHPTMKPVALIERAIRNSSDVGDAVVDLFGGSGSTLIACHQTSRVAYLLELDPVYVDVICARYQLATGVQPILESTGTARDFGLVPA